MKMYAKKAAVKKAFESTFPVYKHGAVVDVGGSLAASGTNEKKAIFHKANVYSTHAEIAAISKLAPEKLHKAKLYVARISAAGKIVNSKPCLRCQKYLKSLGVRTVYFSLEGLSVWGQMDL